MADHRPVHLTRIPVQGAKSLYPEPFASLVRHRTRRRLGDHFSLTNFGVNFTTLAPGAISALKHHHSRQDEFIYILSGTPTLVHGDEEFPMSPGDCIGFKASSGLAHQLLNRSSADVTYLEVGDRLPGDTVEYPDDDLALVQGADGAWSALHKDGSPY